MQWVFNAVAVVALLLAGLALLVIWIERDEALRELRELKTRVNILDEVVTGHSEEIDELERSHRTDPSQAHQA